MYNTEERDDVVDDVADYAAFTLTAHGQDGRTKAIGKKQRPPAGLYIPPSV